MSGSFSAGFTESCASVRSWITAAAVGAYGMIQFGNFNATVASNAWDVLVPAMTDATVLANISLGWWLMWLIPRIVRAAQPTHLIRHGSPTVAMLSHLTRFSGNMLGVLLPCALVLTAEGLWPGWAMTWSEATVVAGADGISAFSATALSQWFQSPVVGVVVTSVYAVVGYLAMGTVVLALACRRHPGAAVAVALGLCTWTLFCSFAPIGVPTALDSTFAVELAWALDTPGGLCIGLGWWFVLASAAVGVLAAPHHAIHLRTWSGRLGSTMFLFGLLIINSLDASSCARRQGRAVSECFFAGSAGDIVSYATLAAVPLCFATAFLARITSGAGGLCLVQALRFGSFRLWLGRLVARECLWALGLSLGAGTLIVAASCVAAPQFDPFASPMLVRGSAGLLGELLLQIILAAALLWFTTDITVTWLTLAGAGLALGYALPQSMTWLNVFAPYSAVEDEPPGAALLSTAVAVGALMATNCVRATPKHADQLA